jgi:hypothetical protein
MTDDETNSRLTAFNDDDSEREDDAKDQKQAVRQALKQVQQITKQLVTTVIPESHFRELNPLQMYTVLAGQLGVSLANSLFFKSQQQQQRQLPSPIDTTVNQQTSTASTAVWPRPFIRLLFNNEKTQDISLHARQLKQNVGGLTDLSTGSLDDANLDSDQLRLYQPPISAQSQQFLFESQWAYVLEMLLIQQGILQVPERALGRYQKSMETIRHAGMFGDMPMIPTILDCLVQTSRLDKSNNLTAPRTTRAIGPLVELKTLNLYGADWITNRIFQQCLQELGSSLETLDARCHRIRRTDSRCNLQPVSEPWVSLWSGGQTLKTLLDVFEQPLGTRLIQHEFSYNRQLRMKQTQTVRFEPTGTDGDRFDRMCCDRVNASVDATEWLTMISMHCPNLQTLKFSYQFNLLPVARLSELLDALPLLHTLELLGSTVSWLASESSATNTVDEKAQMKEQQQEEKETMVSQVWTVLAKHTGRWQRLHIELPLLSKHKGCVAFATSPASQSILTLDLGQTHELDVGLLALFPISPQQQQQQQQPPSPAANSPRIWPRLQRIRAGHLRFPLSSSSATNNTIMGRDALELLVLDHISSLELIDCLNACPHLAGLQVTHVHMIENTMYQNAHWGKWLQAWKRFTQSPSSSVIYHPDGQHQITPCPLVQLAITNWHTPPTLSVASRMLMWMEWTSTVFGWPEATGALADEQEEDEEEEEDNEKTHTRIERRIDTIHYLQWPPTINGLVSNPSDGNHRLLKQASKLEQELVLRIARGHGADLRSLSLHLTAMARDPGSFARLREAMVRERASFDALEMLDLSSAPSWTKSIATVGSSSPTRANDNTDGASAFALVHNHAMDLDHWIRFNGSSSSSKKTHDTDESSSGSLQLFPQLKEFRLLCNHHLRDKKAASMLFATLTAPPSKLNVRIFCAVRAKVLQMAVDPASILMNLETEDDVSNSSKTMFFPMQSMPAIISETQICAQIIAALLERRARLRLGI